MKRKTLLSALLTVSCAFVSRAEETLSAEDAAMMSAPIIEAGPPAEPKTEEKTLLAPVVVNTIADAETEEDPSLDESHEVPSGEDFFEVEAPSDFSAPDAIEPEVKA